MDTSYTNGRNGRRGIAPRRIGTPLLRAAAQTVGYMERSGAETGHLAVFDRREDRDWSAKVFRRSEVPGEHQVVVWGM